MRIWQSLIVLVLATSVAVGDHAKKTRVPGKIVNGYPEGEGMNLHINLGKADGVEKGAKGEILVGETGESKLPNGAIEVTDVVDDHHCVAKTKVKKLGGSNRVVVEATPPAKQKDRAGHIVSSFHDGDGMTLHIDRGKQHGIEVGTKGAILAGDSGETRMPGGEFEVVKLVDEDKCIAHAKIKSTNRNTRVVFEH